MRFPTLHKKLSGISLPCLLLLSKHSYGLLVFGVGPAICRLTLHWVPFTCGLAVKAEPSQGKLSALGSQDGVAGAVSYLGCGWTRVWWSCKAVAFKESSLLFLFLLFSLKAKIGESLWIYSKGIKLIFRSIYLESPYSLFSLPRLKSNLIPETSAHLAQGEGDKSEDCTPSPPLLSWSRAWELEWENSLACFFSAHNVMLQQILHRSSKQCLVFVHAIVHMSWDLILPQILITPSGFVPFFKGIWIFHFLLSSQKRAIAWGLFSTCSSNSHTSY